MNKIIPFNIEICQKYKKYIEEKYNENLMTNPKSLTKEEHIGQIVQGLTIQEITTNYLKQILNLKIEGNEEVGKDMYDTDDYDILIENEFKIDIKSSKALRHDYLKADAIILVEQIDEGYEIKGFYFTKELTFRENGIYLIPENKIKKLETLIKYLKKKYGNKNK
jgi:hypothetical protein